MRIPPSPGGFGRYPIYVYFDARPETIYTKEQLSRVGLISQSFDHYSKWNGKGVLTKEDKISIQNTIGRVHEMRREIRLWSASDHINSWKVQLNLGVDYLNTDKVDELGQYLRNRPGAVYREDKPYQPYQPTSSTMMVRGK